jgi:hypothetical protein
VPYKEATVQLFIARKQTVESGRPLRGLRPPSRRKNPCVRRRYTSKHVLGGKHAVQEAEVAVVDSDQNTLRGERALKMPEVGMSSLAVLGRTLNVMRAPELSDDLS